MTTPNAPHIRYELYAQPSGGQQVRIWRGKHNLDLMHAFRGIGDDADASLANTSIGDTVTVVFQKKPAR